MKLKDPDLRVLLAAIALGLLVGISAVLGWAKVTPAAEGWFTFTAVIIGAGVRRR